VMNKIEEIAKIVFYDQVYRQLKSIIGEERDLIANMANLASFLYQAMADVNWVGFYRLKNNELVIGPFQGKPACVRIAIGKGICGKAAEERKTVIVADVHAFEGHIACDPQSDSEIVVPIIDNGLLIGVLDIDSPIKNCFWEYDKAGLERIVRLLSSA